MAGTPAAMLNHVDKVFFSWDGKTGAEGNLGPWRLHGVALLALDCQLSGCFIKAEFASHRYDLLEISGPYSHNFHALESKEPSFLANFQVMWIMVVPGPCFESQGFMC